MAIARVAKRQRELSPLRRQSNNTPLSPPRYEYKAPATQTNHKLPQDATPIAEGNFGTVYKANGNKNAIKVVKLEHFVDYEVARASTITHHLKSINPKLSEENPGITFKMNPLTKYHTFATISPLIRGNTLKKSSINELTGNFTLTLIETGYDAILEDESREEEHYINFSTDMSNLLEHWFDYHPESKEKLNARFFELTKPMTLSEIKKEIIPIISEIPTTQPNTEIASSIISQLCYLGNQLINADAKLVIDFNPDNFIVTLPSSAS